ncbi:unnamed protein product [Symbiodinium microadriaticum]|nr:unnamed protein product [Symbiodinium microadriaticum]
MERRLNRARMEINALAEDIDKRIMLQPPRDMPTGSLVDDARCCINKDKDTCLHDIETSLAMLKSRVDVALQASNPDGNSTEAPSMLWASIQEVPVIMAQPFLDGFKEATVVKVEDEVVCTARSQEFEQLTSWVRRELSQVHEKLDVKFQKLHSLLEGLKTSRQGPTAAEVAAPATEPFASASAPSLSGSPGKALRNSRPKQDHPSVRHMLEEFRTSQLCMVEEQQTTKSMIEDFRQLLLSQVEELAKEQKSCRSMLEELRVSQRGFAEDQIVSVVREEFEQLCRTNSTSLEEFQQQQQSFRHDLQELAKEQKSFRRTMEDLRVSQLGFTEDLPKPRSIKIVREECERGWRNIRTSQEVSRSKLDEPPPCDVAGLPLPKPSIAEEQRVNREIKRAHLKETQSLNLEAARFGLGETAVQQAASTPVSPVSARCSVSFGEVNRTRLPSQKQKQTSVQQEEASQLKVRLIMSPRTEEPEKEDEKRKRAGSGKAGLGLKPKKER